MTCRWSRPSIGCWASRTTSSSTARVTACARSSCSADQGCPSGATPAPTIPTPAPAVTASGVPKARDPGGAVAMLDDHAAIPLSGRLAQALGTDAATFRQLFDAAVHEEDAAVRAEAMRACLAAVDAEPEFRNRVLQALNTLDDFTLTEMLRGLAGRRAAELAAHI